MKPRNTWLLLLHLSSFADVMLNMDFSTLSSKQYSKVNNITFLEKLVLHYQREVDRQVYNLHVNATFTVSFGGQVL